MSDFKNQSPWGSPPPGGNGDGGFRRGPTPPNIDEIVKKLRKSTKEGQELDAIDNRVDNILLTLSYPNLKAKAVDLNNALASSDSMLSFALNPNTLKLTNETQ